MEFVGDILKKTREGKKILISKVIIIKSGIFLSLATYWGVILVGTFITFN